MGTITSLLDRLRRPGPTVGLLSVTAHGFATGDAFVAWQTVSEIRACKVDRGTREEALLEFVSAGSSVVVSEEQPGFAGLEAAMCAVFPGTATWRERVLARPSAPQRTVLFQRG